MLDFDKHFPGAKRIMLSDNFRSGEMIVQAAGLVISRCIYCHDPHLMTRYSPVTIQYDNMIFRNCEKYLCDVRRNYFYIVTDYDGKQFYLDQWLNEKGTP